MEKKLASTTYEVHDLIRQRWSPRSFDPERLVEKEKLMSLFEAARLSASSFNEQPWRFIVATKANEPSAYQKLEECLMSGNRPWASQAPVLILVVGKLFFSHNQNPNRHALHDVGLAIGNLSVQATSHGLSLHQMAGFDRKKAQISFNIPEGFEAVSVIALGYRGSPDAVGNEVLKQREKAPQIRKSLEEIMGLGKWPS